MFFFLAERPLLISKLGDVAPTSPMPASMPPKNIIFHWLGLQWKTKVISSFIGDNPLAADLMLIFILYFYFFISYFTFYLYFSKAFLIILIFLMK